MFSLLKPTFVTLSNLNTRVERHGDDSVSAIEGVVVRPVLGYEGLYCVSQDGRVWSMPRSWSKGKHAGKWLKPWKVNRYLSVCLVDREGKMSKLYVHRIVGFSWVENQCPETRTHINHKDGNRQNNCASNLEWCDRSMNIQHAYDTGARVVSEKVIAHAKTMRQKQKQMQLHRAKSGQGSFSAVH